MNNPDNDCVSEYRVTCPGSSIARLPPGRYVRPRRELAWHFAQQLVLHRHDDRPWRFLEWRRLGEEVELIPSNDKVVMRCSCGCAAVFTCEVLVVAASRRPKCPGSTIELRRRPVAAAQCLECETIYWTMAPRGGRAGA